MMKTRGKILAAVAVVTILLFTAYLLTVMLVMPDFYRKRLPESLADRLTGAGLFSARLEKLEFGGIPVDRAVLKFRPGRTAPHAVVLDGVKLDCRLDVDRSVLLNGVRLQDFFARFQPYFNDLAVTELEIDRCSLSGGPVVQLQAKFYSADWSSFDVALESAERNRPFRLRVVCAEENPEQIRVSLSGHYSLPVLLNAMRELGFPAFSAPITTEGDAKLKGWFVLYRGGGIGGAHLTADLRNAEISNGGVRLRSGENTRVSYSREPGGKASVETAGVLVEAPFRVKVKKFTADWPDHSSTAVEFAGQLEWLDGQVPGVKLLEAENISHAFRGTYTPSSGFWTAWSESGKDPAEMVLNIHDRLIKLGGVQYEWNGSGSGLNSGGFSLSLKNEYALSISPSVRHSFSGVTLNLHANFTGETGKLELRGDFGAEQGAGDGFQMAGVSGTAALTLNREQLQGTVKCQFAEVAFQDYGAANLALAGEVRSFLPGGKGERFFKGRVAASEFNLPLAGEALIGKNLAVDTEVLLDASGRLRSAAGSGGSESLSCGIFTLENPQGTAALKQDKVEASVKFSKFSAVTEDHKFFSPDGQIRISGICKGDKTALQGSLETVELWYLNELLSGKLDRIGLMADFSPRELALRLNAAEGNAESKSGKFRSGGVSGSYSARYNTVRQGWETDRLLSGIQFQNLEWNSEQVVALFPVFNLSFGHLTVRNAELTVGAFQLQKVSLQQHLPGDGQLNVARLMSNGRHLGALTAASALDRDGWRFKGTLPLAVLNKAVATVSGSVVRVGMVPQLTVAYQIPGFSLPDPVDPGMLNPAWKGLQVSGDGALSGECTVAPSGIRQKLHANLKNIAVFSEHWAMDAVKGELEITDLGKNQTAPHQRLTFGSMIIGGCELSRGDLTFHSIDPERFRVEHAAFDSFGGRISTAAPVTVNPSAEAIRLPFQAADISLPQLLARIGLPDAGGQGKAGGSLPVEYRKRNINFHGARLTGYDGLLRLRGLEKFNAGAPRELLNNGSLSFIQAVLQDFIYRNLTVTLEPGVLRLQGQGRPAANVPFRYDTAGKRFVKVDPLDGIGSELELDTEIRF
jgi:hypothetical protein